MAGDPKIPDDGEGQPDRSAEASEMIAAFNRIRDAAKRRILVELVRAVAEDQLKANGS